MSEATTLTMWIYDSALGAAAGEVRLKDLEQRNALAVHDAMTVTWFPGAHEPRVGHVRHKTLLNAEQGSVLGVILDAVLFPSVGHGDTGALLEKVGAVGIERTLLDELTSRLAPGRSVLVVLASEADPETVRSFVSRGLARGDVDLLYARLTDDAPARLRAMVDEAALP